MKTIVITFEMDIADELYNTLDQKAGEKKVSIHRLLSAYVKDQAEKQGILSKLGYKKGE